MPKALGAGVRAGRDASGGDDLLHPPEARAAAAGIATKIGNHTFRATGLTAYLRNGGTLENAAVMTNHASTRTTQLYDRQRDEIRLNEAERIRV